MADPFPENTGTPVPIEETDRLIASNKVEGAAVYDSHGERMGEVHNFMVDKRTGQVEYAVMSFGGFLGLGEQYHPLPWKILKYDTKLGGYVVGINKEKLRSAPSYRRGEEPLYDQSYAAGLYGFYGIPYSPLI